MTKMNLENMNQAVQEAIALYREDREGWTVNDACVVVAVVYNMSEEDYEYLFAETEFWVGKPKKK